MGASVLCKTKMAAGSLGSTVSPSRVAKPQKSFVFCRLKNIKTAIVNVKIQQKQKTHTKKNRMLK